MAKRKSQEGHNNMVRLAVSHFKLNGYSNIKADVPGYNRPEKITSTSTGQDYIPDVTGDGIPNVIIEVETADTIDDEHTKDQWSSFAAYAKQYKEKFWVAVPEGSEQKAKDRLAELGIEENVLIIT